MRTQGEPCMYCDEPVLDGEQAPAAEQPFHHECLFRMVMGSVGHITRKCSCHGGNEEDPPGVSRRVAAKMAYDLWHKMRLEFADSFRRHLEESLGGPVLALDLEGGEVKKLAPRGPFSEN